jgi:hypothetical protein
LEKKGAILTQNVTFMHKKLLHHWLYEKFAKFIIENWSISPKIVIIKLTAGEKHGEGLGKDPPLLSAGRRLRHLPLVRAGGHPATSHGPGATSTKVFYQTFITEY